MEPNSITYMQYLEWVGDEFQDDVATEAILTWNNATSADINMDSLTAATTTDLGELCDTWLAGPGGTGVCADNDTIQIVDDPDHPILTLDDPLVSSAGSTIIEWSDYDTTFYMGKIKIEDLNCSDSQFLTIKDQRLVCVTPSTLTIIKEVPMWTISNILIVAIIAALVFKLMPKVTLFNFFKVVWKLVIRPFRRREAIVKGSWKHAEYATRGKEDKEV